MVLKTIFKPSIYVLPDPVLWPKIGRRWEDNDLYKKSAANCKCAVGDSQPKSSRIVDGLEASK